MSKPNHPDSVLIDALGGTSRVAEFLEITTGAVSQWRRLGIPKSRKKTLRYAKPKIYREWEAAMRAETKEPSHA